MKKARLYYLEDCVEKVNTNVFFRARAKHTLFSMMHPLDEVSPVICRTGTNANASKIDFVTESSQKIVFTCEEPSLVMTYDKVSGLHTIWALRRAKQDVSYLQRNLNTCDQ